MKIASIDVFQVDLRGRHGGQALSGGRVVASVDSTIVRLVTDTGIIGWGESVPWGPVYLPAFARGVRAAIDEMAPQLIGLDPRQLGVMCEAMDQLLMGHGYAKHGLEMACWDIFGKSTGLPLYMLLGGMQSQELKVSAHIGARVDPQLEGMMARYRGDGIKQFAAKASGDAKADIAFIRALGERLEWDESVKVDVNGGWRVDEGLRVIRGIGDIDITLEQPCRTYEECRDLRRACGIPMILDECAADLNLLLRAREDGVLDGVSIKPGRVGGLSAARRMRDFCAELNVGVHIQCMGGSGITSAAISHLAHSTPERVLLHVWDPMNLIETETTDGAPVVERSRIRVDDRPGLGVSPRADVLGQPVARYR
ncbi:mandelate racemase/muconate lactonizing enzyme family protein [Marinobacterium rhizophilum]|uniref:Mandelate racemase/muconate lactonizing enzyme family protein n=1 Tax=Marinobacterium rhizophilum TaxID=420402 RepID=A0ABY5HPB4_9GAMM|nr:mandelate racemase/muconate lactonizing enzyme family protein [Marinobacterium rhizophilum]UTW13067.1 mandelate racemase/muconate lactonizing enzyme family protein [Marinobacterium rhizophilum]